MSFISVKQSANVGDLFSMIPALKQLSKHHNKKILICQRINMVGAGFDGSNHPFKDKNGYDVCINQYMFDMAAPLIKAQSWVQDFVKYEGQKIDYDLDIIRSERYTTMPNGSINHWLFYVYPEMICDLSKKSIELPKVDFELKAAGKVIINRTQRYFNNYTTYFFLNKYKESLIFAGLPQEHEHFCNEWNLDIPLLQVKDFLELAQEIDNCKFYFGNQSMAFQIAENLKKERLLEVFERMPNVIPCGYGGYEFLHQPQCEYLVKLLFSEKTLT